MTRPIRVVVADDSPFVCRLLTTYLEPSPDIKIVGTAPNGRRAVELVRQLKPDALTLDLDMPEMDGLEALQQIMLDCPTPVVMVSGVSREAAMITLQALELGAVDFVLKYTPGIDTNPEALRWEIIDKVRAASKIKVVRSIRSKYAQLGQRLKEHRDKESEQEVARQHHAVEPHLSGFPTPRPYTLGPVVVIGASTGGPIALRELLSQLPANFPAAIIVVQHIPAGFTEVLSAQLNNQISLTVKEAENGDRLEPGLVLVAPGGYHLLLQPNGRVMINQGAKIKGHRPSIDVTMQSVAQVYGAYTTGVVLTGMGDDGSLGLVAIQTKGGKTFAQSADTCVVNGMPQRAIEKGAVNRVGSPPEIARLLKVIFSHRSSMSSE